VEKNNLFNTHMQVKTIHSILLTMQHLPYWGLECADATKFAMSDVVMIDVDETSANQELMNKHLGLGLGQAERPATPKTMNYEASKSLTSSGHDDYDRKKTNIVEPDPIAQNKTKAFKFSGHTQKFLAKKYDTKQDTGWSEILF
jgi:hypothetical protein